MVGSVLMQRMQEEGDFDLIRETTFFSTSQVGEPAPLFGGNQGHLVDAFDLDALREMDVIITCQGGGLYQQGLWALAGVRLVGLLD